VDLNDLGSGFELASRDLEIRGAGALFGIEQSGEAGKVSERSERALMMTSIRAEFLQTDGYIHY